jgi:hypothetical protein
MATFSQDSAVLDAVKSYISGASIVTPDVVNDVSFAKQCGDHQDLSPVTRPITLRLEKE